MTGPAAVRLVGVHKNFGSVQAVRGIDLTVPSGQVMAFLGPNGAGKTTTIDMILGLAKPSAGTVEVYGTSPGRAVRKGMVAAVMQTGGLLRDLTVAETVEYTASLFGRTEPRTNWGRARAARSPNNEHRPVTRPVDEVLERAGISAIRTRLVGKCSGGEQQRLRFAMALLPDPALLILDEPTQGMDVEGRRDFWRAIRTDAQRGRTIMFATHYLEEADDYADRVVLLRRGEIVADGTSAQVKSRAAGRVVRATLPGAQEAVLRSLPGVTAVEIRGDLVVLTAGDSDLVARHLLNNTAARDLEINAAGLEDAFVALTADTPETVV